MTKPSVTVAMRSGAVRFDKPHELTRRLAPGARGFTRHAAGVMSRLLPFVPGGWPGAAVACQLSSGNACTEIERHGCALRPASGGMSVSRGDVRASHPTCAVAHGSASLRAKAGAYD